jgi:hypothetical protein
MDATCVYCPHEHAERRGPHTNGEREGFPVIVPILHAGGFSWDEAIVLVVAIAAVPVISWFTGRFVKRGERPAASRESRRERRRATDPSSDEPLEP